MASIFFSHSGKDEQIAEKLKRQLEQMGSDVYMFEHDQQPGAGITDKITKAIDNHDMLFALLTKNGGQSSYVQQEIGYAKKAGKPIIPFVESGIGQEALGMVADVEYISLLKNPLTKLIRKREGIPSCTWDNLSQSPRKQAHLPKNDKSPSKKQPKRRHKRPLLDKAAVPILVF